MILKVVSVLNSPTPWCQVRADGPRALRRRERRSTFPPCPADPPLREEPVTRPCRFETIGGLYHVMFRGNRRQRIFRDDGDRRFLLNSVSRLKSRFDLEIYAFVLMPNHAHFLVRRMHDPLARFMAALLTRFARYFNRKYDLVGHVFQGRYRGLLCQDETYLLRLVRYIHLNPLRAGLSDGVEYAWSSYGAYLRMRHRGIVDPAHVLERFGKDPAAARAAFRSYHDGADARSDVKDDFMPRRGVFLGSEDFEALERRRAARSREVVPRPRPSLDEILRESLEASGNRVDLVEVRGPSQRHVASLARSAFVESAVETHGYGYVEVGGFLNRAPESVRVILSKRRARRVSGE